MSSEPTKAFATRLPATEAELLQAVVEETDLTRSDIVKRALRHYLADNPDQIRILTPEDSLDRFIRELVE